MLDTMQDIFIVGEDEAEQDVCASHDGMQKKQMPHTCYIERGQAEAVSECKQRRA